MIADRTLVWTSSVLGFFFVLSWGLYLLTPGTLTRTVLSFPAEIGHSLVPEVRSLPFNWDREHNAELLIREVLLGPARHDHLRLFSRQAGVKSVLFRGGSVYVDLTKNTFIPDPDALYSPVKALGVLRTTIINTFTGVSEVVFSVEGEPVPVNVVDKG